MSGAIGAVLIVATMVMMLVGSMGAMHGSTQVIDSQRLSEIASTTAAEIASAAVSSGGGAVADSYQITDKRLGAVTVTVSTSGNVVTVTASAPGLSARTAQFTEQ